MCIRQVTLPPCKESSLATFEWFAHFIAVSSTKVDRLLLHNLKTLLQTMLGIAGKGKGPTQAALYARAAGHCAQGDRPG